jgi:peptide/nickel transport system substrate-binding protein
MGVAGLATHDINRKPVGIGPFKVTEWQAGQFIAVEAVPTFFLGAPRSQTILFKIISDTNAVLAALSTGDADAVTEDALSEFSGPDLDRMEQQRLIKAYYTPSATWEHIDLNLDNQHLKDVRVRRAIAFAINRQLIVDKVLNGKTQVIHSWAPAWSWWYNPGVTRYDYSPAKAKDLLAQAGYTAGSDGILQKDGAKLSLKYQTTANNKTRELVTQIVQSNLKDVGIDARLEYIPASQYFSGGQNPGPLVARTFELGEFAWVSGDDPAGTQNLYHTSSIPSSANSFVGSNYAGFRNTRNDQLLHDTENSLDQAVRTTMYAEQEQLFADQVPVVPLYARSNVTAITRGLQNFRPTPTNTPPTWNSYDWFIQG